MSKLFDYLYNELGVTALGSQLADIEHIVLGDEEYINRQNEAMALSPAPAKTAEEVEKTQKFLNPYSINEKEKYGIFHLGFYSGYTTSLQSQPCQTGYSREDVKKAVDLGLSISTMSDEPFTSAKFRKTKEACIKSFLSSLTNKP